MKLVVELDLADRDRKKAAVMLEFLARGVTNTQLTSGTLREDGTLIARWFITDKPIDWATHLPEEG